MKCWLSYSEGGKCDKISADSEQLGYVETAVNVAPHREYWGIGTFPTYSRRYGMRE